MTKNFSISEFKCKCNKCDIPEDVKMNLQTLANNLQIIREHINRPISINSGYRCESHNKKIKGAKNSFHVKGMASDITVSGLTPKQVFDIIEGLMDKGLIIKGGLKAYSSWVHYDLRGRKVKY